MSSDVMSCYLYSRQELIPPVYLPNEEEVFVGRSVETQIKDTKCSRKQVRLFASYKDRRVFIQQHGIHVSGFNGFKTEHGAKYVAQHGDILEVLYGKYPYTIEFNPPPKVSLFGKKIREEKNELLKNDLKKRKLSENSEDDNLSTNLKKTKLGDISFDDSLDEQMSIHSSSRSPSKSPIKSPTKSSIKSPIKSPTKSPTKMPFSSSINSDTKIDDSAESGKWEHFSNKMLYVYTSSGCVGRSKIAAYDMDKTLIKTKSGLEFPKDANDWELLYPEVPGKLKKYYDSGYKVVIFSNQANLGMGRVSLKDFKLKIERLVKKIGIPMQVYLAVGQSIFRKPRTGMWEFLLKKRNDDVMVDKENSFFVGDAAGRPASASRKKKDHSIADRLLAINLNLTFYTPEEHFLKHKRVSYNGPSFHPKEASKNTVLFEPTDAKLISDEQELIIMVGSPGSGKSHFVKEHLKSYYYVNRDTLGSWQRCVLKTREALGKGKSVVIDNTNPDRVSRKRYIEVAQEFKIPVRCFVMNLDKEHVKHNNMFRILTDPTHEMISDMVINSYAKSFMQPSEDEGFSKIIRINFVPFFKSEEDRKLYEMYLLG